MGCHIASKFSLGDFSSLGVRHEDIDGEVANYLIDTVKGQKQELSAASISGIWQVTDSTSVFLVLTRILAGWPGFRSESRGEPKLRVGTAFFFKLIRGIRDGFLQRLR